MPRGVYERRPKAKVARPIVYCKVEGCERVAKRPAMRLCERHYYRQRTHGSFDNPRKPSIHTDRNGYHRISAQGHPAASKSGVALVHRMVFYDAHGMGPHACHWCGVQIGWREMHVDHLNDDPGDNALGNLAPSCPPCNTNRGRHKSAATNIDRYALKLAHAGETRTLRDWATRLGIAKESLKWRLDRGWSVSRALTEPRGKFGPRARS